MDIRVEKATIEEASFSSLLYFIARMPVIAAEGIALITNTTYTDIFHSFAVN